jgi:hypothetical protein
MFKENNQPKLFSFENNLPEKMQDRLNNTQEKAFYHLIFRNIKESDYKNLYSNISSRPNVPVNILVASLVLKERKGWSFDELLEHVMFDLRTKTALGLTEIDEIPYGRATIFNFQNRLQDYEQTTGINLLETTFDNLTGHQLEKLKIKTDIQRSDSTQISSNIRKYSRVQLLIEVILRLFKILEDDDKEKISERIEAYSKLGSQKYVYTLKSSDLTHELEKLGNLYSLIFSEVKEKYSDKTEFKNLERVYKEHFTVIENATHVKPNSELNSGILQSPDDEDSTYRKKRGQESQGSTINATETANPENKIQLINDIDVNKNNIDDSTILENKIDKIIEKTPGLKEMHTDGGYGSEGLDKKMEKHGVTHVTTAVKGRQSTVGLTITQNPDNEKQYTVECPEQSIKSMPTKKRNKAHFETENCNNCPLKEKCNILKNRGKYYFTHSDYLKNERNKNILKIPKERRKIRPNVEATMKEFKAKTKNGKLKVRGIFKASLFAYAMGISINFGRIYRLLVENGLDFFDFLVKFNLYIFYAMFYWLLSQNQSHRIKLYLKLANIEF